jgi:glycosyltransferase involved in cell wall biosynthesis
LLSWWNPLSWLHAGLTVRGDVLHAQWWSYPLAPVYVTVLAIARMRGKRVVLTVHNVQPHESGWLRRIANRLVFPLAHHFVVHTRAQADALTGRIATERVTVIPMGVEPPVPVTSADRTAARRELGIEDATPVALFLGNIRPYKGLSVLVDAFHQVAREIPTAALLVAGQPWCSARDVVALIDQAGVRDRVHVKLQYITDDEMRAHYAAADVVVYPYTHFDAQSAAACDALRYGKAVIVTNVGGLPELVADERAVVAPNDVDALAHAMLRALGDREWIRSLEHDSLRIAATWTWALAAAQTARIYYRITSNKGSSRVAAERSQ